MKLIFDFCAAIIDASAEHYAKEAFERYRVDRVTLSLFMGRDSVLPCLKYEGKGAYLLCRAPTLPLLIPSVGVQGGNARATVQAGLTATCLISVWQIWRPWPT